MNWLIFALIGTASFAATGILDKFILNRYIENSAAYLVALIIIQQIFAILILIFKFAAAILVVIGMYIIT
ncbi:hypothetical protein ANME2D_02891 [Candidatus Methanoperedens nitroreducens]|uniref:Uncharacterized protein n=1 Tax=Candidatus Methanoperedens nitratireducens TaxID=1392998 RepID=A0A062UV17_9EURY|nr:hypothetical protein [Candidatus Methanoperedens nitroreducens]KCZ70866.1 hypothetical protein ANME2D_02891 [Candidatus Methanoperedens nitroreducens]MDJ1420721.1 hypothetical protein [Candidatus Methanoperedens sp.]